MANYMKPKRKSFVAGVISFIGSLVFVWGLYHILSAVFIIVTSDNSAAGSIVLGILLIILCFVIQYAAIIFDKYREHRKWIKRIVNAGIEPELSENEELCWQAYRSNPTPFCLKYIEARNAKAADNIRAYLSENPSTFSEKLLSRGSAETFKIHHKKDKTEETLNIETDQNWADGETIIK